jgi:hypothetical protein
MERCSAAPPCAIDRGYVARTGEGIYITKDDYDSFVQAVIDFWTWLAGVVG